jgi:hypothetical protein
VFVLLALQPCLIFEVRPAAIEGITIRLGFTLAVKYQTRAEWLVRKKHSSLFVMWRRKKVFITFAPGDGHKWCVWGPRRRHSLVVPLWRHDVQHQHQSLTKAQSQVEELPVSAVVRLERRNKFNFEVTLRHEIATFLNWKLLRRVYASEASSVTAIVAVLALAFLERCCKKSILEWDKIYFSTSCREAQGAKASKTVFGDDRLGTLTFFCEVSKNLEFNRNEENREN